MCSRAPLPTDHHWPGHRQDEINPQLGALTTQQGRNFLHRRPSHYHKIKHNDQTTSSCPPSVIRWLVRGRQYAAKAADSTSAVSWSSLQTRGDLAREIWPSILTHQNSMYSAGVDCMRIRYPRTSVLLFSHGTVFLFLFHAFRLGYHHAVYTSICVPCLISYIRGLSPYRTA